MAAALARRTMRGTIDARSAALLAAGSGVAARVGEEAGSASSRSPQWEHERVVAAAVASADSRDPLAIARALAKVSRPFRKALAHDLQAAGLVDAERLAVAQGLATTAWVGAVFSLLCGAVAQVALYRFGWWPQVIPAAMLVMSGALFWFGRRFSVWSRDGVLAARWWREKVKALAAIQPRAIGSVDDELPFAVAAGLGPLWLRRYGAQLTLERRQLAEALIRAHGISGLRQR
jgi:hypothetical protein